MLCISFIPQTQIAVLQRRLPGRQHNWAHMIRDFLGLLENYHGMNLPDRTHHDFGFSSS
jgi:hypothetical protein